MKKNRIVVGGFLLVGLTLIRSCDNGNDKILKEGEQLARSYCISCHAFPEPDLLDKKTWEDNVLPQMGQFMNVDIYYEPYNNSGPSGDVNVKRVSPENQFPYEKWKSIVAWYITTAPEKPITRKETLGAIKDSLTFFEIHPVYDVVDHPLTTYIGYDTNIKEVLFGDGQNHGLYSLSKDYKAKKIFNVPEGIADLGKNSKGWFAVSMGILKPSDQQLGKLSQLSIGNDPVTILDSLRRPVRAKYADLNGDGAEDIIVSEFGYRNGALSWFEKKENGYEKHVLRQRPGAIDIQVQDLNNDGLPDIAVLMSQGDEGIFIYYNEKNGKFREERVLQFPPSYGSNYFDMADVNNDGFKDIITTQGDNGDNSVILKAYHGIRIFYNDGKNKFTEKLFLPVYGAQKVIAIDFDKDGDIDIASISFFPDYINHANESFIFWENKGNWVFERSTFKNVTEGRWMTMDAKDIDADGDVDIMLGNAFFTLGDVPAALIDKWKKRSLSVMVLENRLYK